MRRVGIKYTTHQNVKLTHFFTVTKSQTYFEGIGLNSIHFKRGCQKLLPRSTKKQHLPLITETIIALMSQNEKYKYKFRNFLIAYKGQ